MLLTESEYKETIKRLEQVKAVIAQQRENLLKISGLSAEEMERVMQPTLCFQDQLREEIEVYEKTMLKP